MNSSKLLLTARSAFDAKGWAYTRIPEREVLRSGFEGHHTRVDLHVQVFADLRAVSVVAESARTTDSPVIRERLAELVLRVNQTLTIGNFEMDWDTGRLIFRVTNLFSKPEGDVEIIQGLIHNTIGEMDRMAPLEAIIHRSEIEELTSLDIAGLLAREDLLPELPVPDGG